MTRLRTILRLALVLGAVWLAVAPGAASAASWVARHGLTSAQYQSVFNNLAGKGYRLKVVSGYTSGGQERYAALWVKTTGPQWAARHGLSSAAYQAAFDDFAKKGFRLVQISGYTVGGQARFAGIWEKTSGTAWQARHNLTAAQYQSTFNDLVGKGYRLRYISGYTVGGQDRYAAIWDKASGPAWVARHGLTASQYQQAFDEFGQKGYRLKVVSGYGAGTGRYAALWEKSSGPLYAARHGVKSAFYQGVFDNYYYQGFYPVYVNAFASGSSARLNAIWENTTWQKANLDLIVSKVRAYMKKHDIPGLSIALTKNGRLVYAAGFGTADKSTGEEVGPNHLFRVASVSKPITSVAAMRLVAQGKLSLGRKVFGRAGILGSVYPTPSNNKKIEDITVRQLLTHTSGFTNAYGDPMFEKTSYTHEQLIKWALAKKVPQNNAGSVYEYSNFGYSVLGRVIERVTGKTYENYVRGILAGIGVTRMSIAGNSLSERKAGEVVYYPSGAYDLNVRRFDAHGGWVATPIDLMRLMVRVDGLSTKPDILSASSYRTMTTKAGVKDKNGNDPGYAMGWVVGSGYQWHNGAMNGTLALMAKAPNGFGYAAVANTRPSGDQFAGELKQMLDQIVAGVSAWPASDLF